MWGSTQIAPTFCIFFFTSSSAGECLAFWVHWDIGLVQIWIQRSARLHFSASTCSCLYASTRICRSSLRGWNMTRQSRVYISSLQSQEPALWSHQLDLWNINTADLKTCKSAVWTSFYIWPSDIELFIQSDICLKVSVNKSRWVLILFALIWTNQLCTLTSAGK